MKILTNTQLQQHLMHYYSLHYGKTDTDLWFPPPAANVRIFQRDGRIITLRCHILTGAVSASVQPPSQKEDSSI